ncbi:phosphotransferase [Sinomonas terrae]|uniref:Phosphotransferase n=1 Tax=Sinomonas terrae TaxID=2908838 RepID=A0ABS9U6X8_9MICC|nr:phosphotransferase [Sinomonas terrae]MCH6472441.1 phosphotransferase [Sinomonas terrae]
MNDQFLLEAGGFQGTYQRMSEPEAARLAAELWSVEGAATRLATEKDDTFVLTTAEGTRYVLKVSNPTELLGELDFEVELHRHVWESQRAVEVPELLVSSEGMVLVPLIDSAGQSRRARMMTFIEGIPLDSTGSSPTERERVGEALARMRHATASFEHPFDDRVYVWDVKNLPRLAPLLEIVADPGQRRLLELGLERFMRIAPLLDGLRSQVLHNDFSKSNIIVDHSDPRFVRAIIDFGDSVRTSIAVDVATALLNQLPREFPETDDLDLLAEGKDLLRGYLREADLTEEELRIIPFLVLGRVVSRALITLNGAAASPHNAEYILRNTEQGWAQLRWFLRQPEEALSAALLQN